MKIQQLKKYYLNHILAGKAYYEKYINELKKNSKIKLGIKKIVLRKNR